MTVPLYLLLQVPAMAWKREFSFTLNICILYSSVKVSVKTSLPSFLSFTDRSRLSVLLTPLQAYRFEIY